MNQMTYAIEQSIANLLHAVPNPQWWSGPAATACAESVERLAADLRSLQSRITAEWSNGH